MAETLLPAPLPTVSATDSATAVERKPRKRELKNLTKRDGVWYFHKLVKGKRLFMGRKTPFSLETRDLVLAKAKRDALLRAGNGAEVARILGRTVEKLATVQEVIDAFMAADYPRLPTRKKYVRDLKLILRRAWGAKRDLAHEPISVLTGDVVANFQDAVVAGVLTGFATAHPELSPEEARRQAEISEEMQVAKYSANRTLTQARSIFANEKPFRKLQAPVPTGFLKADHFQGKRDLSYTPMSPAELTVFGAKLSELKGRALAGESRAVGIYTVWLCMRWLGMRNSEVRACKPAEWLVQTPRGWVMRITNRDYFLVKGPGSVRDLALAEWLRAELVQLAGDREWLVPGGTITDRREFTDYALNNWMDDTYREAIAAAQLPAGTPSRTAYDWRKQAGSELYDKTKDILAVSRWLGHQSVHTTTKWYVSLLNTLPSLA